MRSNDRLTADDFNELFSEKKNDVVGTSTEDKTPKPRARANRRRRLVRRSLALRIGFSPVRVVSFPARLWIYGNTHGRRCLPSRRVCRKNAQSRSLMLPLAGTLVGKVIRRRAVVRARGRP